MNSLRYSLSENDYLEFLMYSSTLTPSHRQQRFRSLLLPIFLGALLAFYAFIRSEATMSACLLFYCGIWFIFNKKYTRWRFTQHFKKQIQKSEASNIGVEANLCLQDEGLTSKELNLTAPIPYNEIEAITKIDSLYLIQLPKTGSLIIPQNGILEGNLETFIQTLSEKTTHPVTDQTNYPWK